MIILTICGLAAVIVKKRKGDFNGASHTLHIIKWVFTVYCAVLTLFCFFNMNEALTATFEGVVAHGMIFLNIVIFIPLAILGKLGDCHPFERRRNVIILSLGIIVITEAVRCYLLTMHIQDLSQFGLNSCLLNFIGVVIGCIIADLHIYRKREIA